MSTVTASPRPLSLIRSSLPSNPEEIAKLLKNDEALRKISSTIGSKCSRARVNAVAVQLIAQELMEEPSQNSEDSGYVGVRKNKKKRDKPKGKPACHRRSARSKFRF